MTTQSIRVPDPEKAPDGYWWIPPFPPHWDDWMGPYNNEPEAEDVCYGLQETINGPRWQMMMLELVDEFEEEWARREQEYLTS